MIASGPAPIAAEEFARRRRAAASLAARRGLDALLVWSSGGSTLDAFGDVFYLTNHYAIEPRGADWPPHWTGFGHCALVLDADAGARATLLVGPPDWRRDLVHVDEVLDRRDVYALVADTLAERGLQSGRIGVARAQLLPLPLYLALRERFPKLQLVPADDLVESLRIVKSPAEIALMRHAQDVSVAVMSAMLAAAEPGRTDGDLAAIGFSAATARGATPWEFAMSSGPHAEHAYHHRLPCFDPRRPYAAGDVVHPDVWGCVDGYFYDFQRSLVVGGEPTAAQREVLEGVIAKVHHVCDALRPGRTAGEVHTIADEWTREHGLAAPVAAAGTDVGSIDFYGHGIGLGFERPLLFPGETTVLQPGMTIAVETYVSGQDGTTAIYEETVLVTDAEPEIMTAACPARWWS
jgi:Xaa-Pro aminopeptidase